METISTSAPNSPRILYLTTFVPHGHSTGHQRVSSDFLTFLCKFSRVDVVSLRPDIDIAKISGKVTNGEYFSVQQTTRGIFKKLLNIISGLLKGYSFQESLNRSIYLKKLLEALVENTYDLAIVETYWLYLALNRVKPDMTVMLAAHSAESVYLECRLTELRVPKFIRGFLLAKVTSTERYLLDQNHLVSMGSVPASILAKKYSLIAQPKTYPSNFARDYTVSTPNRPPSRVLAIIGNYHYYPNAQGLRIFVKEWLKKFLDDNWVVRVIGDAPSKLITDLITMAQGSRGFEILGFVENINEHLADCKFIFCATRIFSGELIKVWTGIEKNKVVLIPQDYYLKNLELQYFHDQIIVYNSQNDFESVRDNMIRRLESAYNNYSEADSIRPYFNYILQQRNSLRSHIENVCSLNAALSV